MTLVDARDLQSIKFDEWLAKAQSAEYQVIKKKLSASTPRPLQQTKATSEKPTDTERRSNPKAASYIVR